MFAETLAISPGEIRDAIERGVVVYGAASMGALRAAEIPRVVGVGRIFEMYRDGAIERDDEVALLFDPDTYKPLTEPLINFRYAVDRLVRSATLSRDSGNASSKHASRLHYTQRTYGAIFHNSALARNRDVEDIIRLLRNFDLKRDDAQFLLETLAQSRRTPPHRGRSQRACERRVRPTGHTPPTHEVLIWESGDSVAFSALIRFLKLTGTFEQFARNALGRFALAGTPLRSARRGARRRPSPQGGGPMAPRHALSWGWESPEEAHVTMRDLGLGLLDLSPSLEAEATARRS